jgi:phosphonate transport system ATP-binding protein
MGDPPVFAVERVDVVFGSSSPALQQVSFSIHPGEALAIVGPSGSGKTTLLRLLNGSIRPTAGDVRVQGRALQDLDARELRRARAAIGFVHQDLRLVPNIRVLHNVIAGRFGRMSLPQALRSTLFASHGLQREVYEILERVGIPEKLHERTDRLSGGQQQRVAIARALFQRPSALLADEPVSSIDPARARDAVRLLAEISGSSGLTLCVSLHNLELAREFFPRLLGLRGGRVVFDQKSSELSSARFKDLYQLTREEILDDAS